MLSLSRLLPVNYLLKKGKKLHKLACFWRCLCGLPLFLIYKINKEIKVKVNHKEYITDSKKAIQKRSVSFSSVISQILMIDIIFSVDSILTAVGMTNGLYPENVELWGQRPELFIMVAA